VWGAHAASAIAKRRFLENVLAHIKLAGGITSHSFTGAGDRHDYQIEMPNGRQAVFEAKGCLDGNNTNIFGSSAESVGKKRDEMMLRANIHRHLCRKRTGNYLDLG
jgi:hypothetical protein